MLPSKHKIHPKLSTSFLCCRLPTSTSQHLTLLPAYLYQKDERALPGKLQSSKLF
jgi:hypothetical protein